MSENADQEAVRGLRGLLARWKAWHKRQLFKEAAMTQGLQEERSEVRQRQGSRVDMLPGPTADELSAAEHQPTELWDRDR